MGGAVDGGTVVVGAILGGIVGGVHLIEVSSLKASLVGHT